MLDYSYERNKKSGQLQKSKPKLRNKNILTTIKIEQPYTNQVLEQNENKLISKQLQLKTESYLIQPTKLYKKRHRQKSNDNNSFSRKKNTPKNQQHLKLQTENQIAEFLINY